MIVTRQDMKQAVPAVIANDLPTIEPGRATGLASGCFPVKLERPPAGKQQPLARREALFFQLDNVTRFPSVPRRELKFIEHILLDRKFGAGRIQRIFKGVTETMWLFLVRTTAR